eukprot:gene5470-9288_t
MPKDLVEYIHKVLVVGDVAVGKTSFINRLVHGKFSTNYKATLGVDFLTFSFEYKEKLFHVQLWDIAGHERFHHLLRVYYKGAVGAFIMFDVTNFKSFDSVPNWKDGIDDKVFLPDGSLIPCVLLANKCDLNHNYEEKDLLDFANEEGFSNYFQTSVKEQFGLEEAIISMIKEIPIEINTVKEVVDFPDCVILDSRSIQDGEEVTSNGTCCK